MVNNYWTIVRISMLQATSTCASAVDIFFLKINLFARENWEPQIVYGGEMIS